MSSDGPRILVGGDSDGFRLVRVENGERITYVLEVPDSCDALGVERWRDVKISGTAMTALFGYLIKIANKLEKETTDVSELRGTQKAS